MPECPECRRELNVVTPVAFNDPRFRGINHCRAAFITDFIRKYAPVTTWGISEAAGLAYHAALKGVEKAKAHGALVWEEEATPKGVRYRFTDAEPMHCFMVQPALFDA